MKRVFTRASTYE